MKIGAFYYMWYPGDGSWKEKCCRYNRYNGKPSLGWYDGSDETIISKHIDMAKEHGIDFFIVSFNGNSEEISNIEKLMSICEKKDFHFCIHYETVNIFEDPVVLDKLFMDSFVSHVSYLVSEFSKSKSFLKLDNRPVFFIYTSRRIPSKLEEINILRREIKERTDSDLFLVGDEIWYSDSKWIGDPDRLKKFDAIYAYNMYVPETYFGNNRFVGKDFLNFIKPTYNFFHEQCSSLKISLFPTVIPRYNDESIRSKKGHYPLLSENGKFFDDYIDFAKKYVSDPYKILLISSFNEWYEDTQIEPCLCNKSGDDYDKSPGYGYSFLEILLANVKQYILKDYNKDRNIKDNRAKDEI